MGGFRVKRTDERNPMSSNNEYAIQVQDVSKIYKLYDKPIDRLKESLSLTHKNYHKDFFALSDISFNVKKGETVGIIGTNGSGKSTILKIITGVLTPTSGQVRVSGVISALLELGAGFNMDYTGIENIYMNGTMMGFSKKQMDEKLPDILEFADIGDFVYQPVKTYSSGMFVRLAIALSINVCPETPEALNEPSAAVNFSTSAKFNPSVNVSAFALPAKMATAALTKPTLFCASVNSVVVLVVAGNAAYIASKVVATGIEV